MYNNFMSVKTWLYLRSVEYALILECCKRYFLRAWVVSKSQLEYDNIIIINFTSFFWFLIPAPPPWWPGHSSASPWATEMQHSVAIASADHIGSSRATCAHSARAAGGGETRRLGTRLTGQAGLSPSGSRQWFQCRRIFVRGWRRGRSFVWGGREQRLPRGCGTSTSRESWRDSSSPVLCVCVGGKEGERERERERESM